jgi:hypothetical protein
MLKASSSRSADALAAQRARAEAQRHCAEAELESLAAQQEAERASAAAEDARQEAERQQAMARHAELRAELDAIGDWQRRNEADQCNRQTAAWEAADARLRELEAWKPPVVRMSPEEIAALRARLDREIEADERRYAIEQEQQRREEIDREWRRRQARTLGALRAEWERQ